VTNVERLWRPSTLRPIRRLRTSRWILSILAVVAVCSSTVTISSRPAAAATLVTLRQQANAIYSRIQATNAQVDGLGQTYDRAQGHLSDLSARITNTKVLVAQAQAAVAGDRSQLEQAAIFDYVNNGNSSAANPLFASNHSTLGAQNIYLQIAEGNVQTAVASLRNASIVLTQRQDLLRSQVHDAAATTSLAAAAFHKAQSLQNQLRYTLSHLKGQIAALVRAAQARVDAANAAAWARRHGTVIRGFPAPPANSRANVAIRFALSMIGVPYVWGGSSRYGVDCSGLTMLSWRAAGVALPHYSGSQMNSTIRVPLWSLRPGDLLFYGRNGSQHVTMYIGNGRMIEAPTFGQRVHISPVRLGYGFAGAGRPRA